MWRWYHAPVTGERPTSLHQYDRLVIGRPRHDMVDYIMQRLRALAVLFACLAVLANGFMAVAASASPLGPPATERSAQDPCNHCDDCDSMPCPIPMASCMQASPSGAIALAATATVLPLHDSSTVPWSLRAAILSGLSRPPDPFPPRA